MAKARERRSTISTRELLERLDEILATSEETRLAVVEMLLKHDRLRREAIEYHAGLVKHQRRITLKKGRARG